jgi:L-threonylcarbamoyladenylate synthase
VADKLPSSVAAQVEKAVSMLRDGGVIAFPTDTVFGLGAVMTLGSVERIYRLKGRPRDMALPLLLADSAQVDAVANDIPEAAWRLIKVFWPGALTLVLHKSPAVPDFITGGRQTVAVRLPRHHVPIALVRGVGRPLASTSANVSGRPSALTTDEVREQLGEKVDLVIEGGAVPGGRESTIVDLTGERPVVLRQGAIPLAELRTVVPGMIVKES